MAAVDTARLAEKAATSAERELRRRQRVATRSVWKRPLTVIGLAILLAWALVAIFAPLITTYGPLTQSAELYAPPSSAHWFGTDELGRDIFSRVMYGTRITLPLAIVLVTLATLIGSFLGAVAGYFGKWTDEVVMRFADLVLAFPAIILAMAVAASLGPSLTNAVVAIVVVSWPIYGRVARSLVLSARETDYVLASRLGGASSRRALVSEILPNISGPLAVLAMLEAGGAIIWLAGLSFLGVGAQPPAPEWGAMVADGATIFNFWWVATFPGLAILTAVLAFNFVGDSLRDALDPQVARKLR